MRLKFYPKYKDKLDVIYNTDYANLVDDTNGVLCDWDIPESIKDAILYMARLTNKELLDKGKKSLAKAETLFSTKVIMNQWIKLMR